MKKLNLFQKSSNIKAFWSLASATGASSRNFLAKKYPWSKKVLLRKTFEMCTLPQNHLTKKILFFVPLLFIFFIPQTKVESACPEIAPLVCPSGSCTNDLNNCIGGNPSTQTSNTETNTQKCSGNLRYDQSATAECARLAELQGRSLGYDISCNIETRPETFVNTNSYFGSCTINGQSGFSPETLVGYGGSGSGYTVPDPFFGTTTAYGSGYNINPMWYTVPCAIVDSIEGRPGSTAGSVTCAAGARQYFGTSNPSSWNATNASVQTRRPNTTNTSTQNNQTNTNNQSNSTQNSVYNYVNSASNILNRLVESARVISNNYSIGIDGSNTRTTPLNAGSNSNITTRATTTSTTNQTNINNSTNNQINSTNGLAMTNSTVPVNTSTSSMSFRFIKIDTTEKGWVSWREIEIFDRENIKLNLNNLQVYAPSFSYAGAQGTPTAHAFDGNIETNWNAGETNQSCRTFGVNCLGRDRNAVFIIDLGSTKNIGKIKLTENGEMISETTTVSVSNNNRTYERLVQFEGPMNDKEVLEFPKVINTGDAPKIGAIVVEKKQFNPENNTGTRHDILKTEYFNQASNLNITREGRHEITISPKTNFDVFRYLWKVENADYIKIEKRITTDRALGEMTENEIGTCRPAQAYYDGQVFPYKRGDTAQKIANLDTETYLKSEFLMPYRINSDTDSIIDPIGDSINKCNIGKIYTSTITAYQKNSDRTAKFDLIIKVTR